MFLQLSSPDLPKPLRARPCDKHLVAWAGYYEATRRNPPSPIKLSSHSKAEGFAVVLAVALSRPALVAISHCPVGPTLQYTRPVHHEQALVAGFVKRARRDRYREFVADPRLRPKFIRELPHFRDFDSTFRLPIPSDKLSVQIILRELWRRHSPSVVFAIS